MESEWEWLCEFDSKCIQLQFIANKKKGKKTSTQPIVLHKHNKLGNAFFYATYSLFFIKHYLHLALDLIEIHWTN